MKVKFRVWGRGQMWYINTPSPDGNDLSLHFFNGGIGWGLYDNVLGNRICTGEHDKLMMFTGLVDRNGRELYESDIIQGYRSNQKFQSDICVIKYSENSFIMAQLPTDEKKDCLFFYDFEIIGNIYEIKKMKGINIKTWAAENG